MLHLRGLLIVRIGRYYVLRVCVVPRLYFLFLRPVLQSTASEPDMEYMRAGLDKADWYRGGSSLRNDVTVHMAAW